MDQVVQVVRMISIDAMRSENMWFSWSKSSNYRERGDVMPVTDKRTDGRKVEKRAVFWYTRNRKMHFLDPS